VLDLEERMSKSQKHEKTTGFLEDLGKARKHAREVRALKTQLLNEMDLLFNPPSFPTAEA